MRVVPDDTLAILTAWQEARGESFEGAVGVCEVIRTRRKLGHWGPSYTQVCLAPYQFSGWNTKDPNRVAALLLDQEDPHYLRMAQAWEFSKDSNLTLGATHYCNLLLASPVWALPDYLTVVIGHHSFYKVPR